VIREARPGDVRAIAELVGRAHLHAVGTPAEASVDELEERWAGHVHGRARVWVAEQDDLLAGVTALDGDEILVLCVDPTAQGAGVGAQLHDLVAAEGGRIVRAPQGSDQLRMFLGARGWREEPDGSGTYVR